MTCLFKNKYALLMKLQRFFLDRVHTSRSANIVVLNNW